MNEQPGIDLAGALPSRATYHPDVVHIFAPELVYGHAIDSDASYVARVHTVNMPYLARGNRQNRPITPLSAEVQSYMSRLAMQSMTLPRGSTFGHNELVGAEAWLSGSAAGLGDEEIARQSEVSVATVGIRKRSLSSYLGASNQAHAMYLAFLHGYRPNRGGDVDSMPHVELTVAENLDLYLAAHGLTKFNVADLLGLSERTVQDRRDGICDKFGAQNITQAIARAFESRYYRSLETHERLAVFGLMDVLRPARPTEGELANSAIYEATMNRPPLVAIDNPTGRRGNEIERPLDPESCQRIESRAAELVRAPFLSECAFIETQSERIQTLTDGLAGGKSQGQVAAALGLTLDAISRTGGPAHRLRDHLGTNNPADTMYSMLLHGYQPPDIELPPDFVPKLLPNMLLHLYLVALGYDTPTAMTLTQQEKRVVTYSRDQAIKRLGARTLQQAVVHAFALGVFRPLPVMGYDLAA